MAIFNHEIEIFFVVRVKLATCKKHREVLWCKPQGLKSASSNYHLSTFIKVSFIAINCWSGTCSLHHKLDLYPKLVAIHSHFDGVEYKGVHKTFRMVSNTQ